VISKAALLDEHWPGVAVIDNTVAQAIVAIRKALGDDPRRPRFIQSLKGKGYRFIGIVDMSGAPLEKDIAHDWVKGRQALETLDAEQLDNATAVFERLVARNPHDSASLTAMAFAHYLQYQLARIENTTDTAGLQCAITQAQQACRLDPLSAEAAAGLACLLAAAGDSDGARAAARQAATLNPDSWQLRFIQAMASWGEERLAAVTRTLKLKGDVALAYFLAAMVFVARQTFDVAEDYAARGAALQSLQASLHAPGFPAFGLHWLRGLLFLRKGEVGKALESFDREITEAKVTNIFCREYRVNAFVGAGHAYLVAGDPHAAAHAFREVLELLPGDARALFGLRQALARRGLHEEAEAAAKRLQRSLVTLSKSGRVCDIALLSAATDAARGNYETACRALNRLLEQTARGQTGWIIPIEPSLAPLRDRPAFSRTLAFLSSRA
jgi:tetratricopeptide (TPR) repeat protein